MNRTYRLIWSELTRTWVAVAEHTSGKGKRSKRSGRSVSAAMRLAAWGSLLSVLMHAGLIHAQSSTQLPTGGQVVAGNASITQSGSRMDINQATQRAVLDWNTFNIGSQAQVNFNQPNASAVTLNRVLDNNPSQIQGAINANGQVFLSNPAGITFGPTASVNVGGLVATTHSISNEDFMAGKNTFVRNGSTGKVVNEGKLQSALGGYIALLAPEVRNSGVVIAQLGTAALAAGESYTLTIAGNNSLAGIVVTPAQIKALVDNQHLVKAPGGLIIMSAHAANSLLGGVVRNSGTLEATGMAMRGGKIVLEASDRIENSGSILANAGSATTNNDGSVVAGGPAGSVTLTTPAILNSGSIAGANVQLSAASFTQTRTGLIDVSSATGAAGNIQIRATQDMQVEGTLLAQSGTAPASLAGDAETGGDISLRAGRNINLQNATLDVSGRDGGGRIDIEGGNNNDPLAPTRQLPGVLLSSGALLRSNSSRGRGGKITLTAEQVDLIDTTRIDTTGRSGGGEIYVGGGWQGSDPAIRQATRVTVSRDSTLNASAIGNGDGGTIAIWSDIHNPTSQTTVAGSLLARGGQSGGNGGRIETSGHTVDTSGITVNAGADHGKGGLWLIDPTDSTIDQTVANGYQATLNTGTSVTNTVSGDIATSGAVTLTKSAGGDAALTLQATGRISLTNTTISSSSGKLDVVLHSNSDSNATGGGVYLNATSITTNGGNLTIGGGADPLTGYAVGYGPSSTAVIFAYAPQRFGVMIDSSTINAGGGNISIRGKTISQQTSDGVCIGMNGGSTITTTSAGSVTIQGESADPGAYNGFQLYPASSIDGGTISIKGISSSSSNGFRTYGNATIGAANASTITLESYYTGSNGFAWSMFFGDNFSTPFTTAIGNANTTLIDLIVDKSNSVSGRGAIAGFTNGVSFTGNGAATLKIRPGNTNTRNVQFGGSSDVSGSWAAVDFSNASFFMLSERLQNATTGFSSIELGRNDQVGATTVATINNTPAGNLSIFAGSGGMSITGNLNTGANNLTLNSAGAITQSGATSLTIGGTTSATASGNVTLANTGNNFTGTVSVTSGGAVSIKDANSLTLGTIGMSGNLTVDALAGDLTVSGNITKSSGANATATLKATGNIVQNAGTAVSSSSNALNTVYNADSDASSDGAIVINNGASITTNGGAITLGGGASPTTTAAFGNATYANGIFIDRASLSAGTGNISLRGTGASTGGDGVLIDGAGALIGTSSGAISVTGTGTGTGAGRYGILVNGATVRTTGGGNITLTGQGSLAGTLANNEGVTIANSLVEIQSGANPTLAITGTGGTGTNYNIGINTRTNATVRMGGVTAGQMNITGTGGTCSGTGCWGVLSEDGGVYESTGAGAINITGSGGTGADNMGFKYSGGAAGRVGHASMTGALTLTANTIDLIGSGGSFTMQGTGALTIKPLTAATTIGIAGGAGTLALPASYFTTQLGNTFSSITVGSTTAGNVTVGGATSVTNPLIVKTAGNITVNGAITDNAGMTLEATGGTSDIILNQPLNTTNGTITVAAAQNFTNNTASNTGLNITGAGRYLVYSTNPANSLEAMTGYQKHYNQTYTSGVTPTYAGTGNWFLYSVAPTLQVTPSAVSSTYGSTVPTATPSYSGFIDGDTNPQVTGTAVFTIGGATSGSGNATVGTHNLAYASGLASALGYTLSDNAASVNELTVTAKTLNVSGLNGDKTYNGTTAATITGTAALTNGGTTGTDGRFATGDTVSVTGSATSAGFGSANASTQTLTLAGLNLAGADAGNYALSTNLTSTIAPAPLTVTANNQAVSFSSSAYQGGNGVNVTGLVNGETIAALSGALSYGGTSQGAVNPGTYNIRPGGYTSGNYAISFIDGSLTINPTATTQVGLLPTFTPILGSPQSPAPNPSPLALNAPPTGVVGEPPVNPAAGGTTPASSGPQQSNTLGRANSGSTTRASGDNAGTATSNKLKNRITDDLNCDQLKGRKCVNKPRGRGQNQGIRQ